jgi:hypothetical protein
MKSLVAIIIVSSIFSCTSQNDKVQKMKATIDSLQMQLNASYKPGFGEFMSGIQTHHAKLWFAGQDQNWPLADFEVHEIQESLVAIQKFYNNRTETKAIGMITPAIDSVNNAIQQKNSELFKSSFILLTNTCNKCHKATEHGFNVVIVPTSLPVVNQDFRPIKQ